jgi:hypothetical protein
MRIVILACPKKIEDEDEHDDELEKPTRNLPNS